MLILQEILGYVLIGAVGMVVLALCYAPVFFLLRKRIQPKRQLACFLFGVCVLVISGATFLETILFALLDGNAVIADQRSLNLIPFRFLTQSWEMGLRKQITQSLANVLMFVPLGFIFPVVFRRMRSFWRTAGCMMLFSFLIEFVQYFIGRSADIDDLILNTLGGMLGYLILKMLFIAHNAIPKRFGNMKGSKERSCFRYEETKS